jgi:hypothetical protein
MREYSNRFNIASRIMMSRSQNAKATYLLVEGDTDSRFFSSFADENCKMLPAYGKDNVIQAIAELEKWKVKGIIGIVDADYWILEGITSGPNLLATDTHDIETMILVSPALEKVLKEFLPGEKLEHIRKLGDEVRKALVKLGLPVGCLRWVSHREKLHLDFDRLPFEQFFNLELLEVDRVKMIKCIDSSRDKTLLRHCSAEIDRLMESVKVPWYVCQGHDLVDILEIVLPDILKRLVGPEVAENARRKVRADSLARELRIAYEPRYFVKTRLYRSMREWEAANKPYTVLSSDIIPSAIPEHRSDRNLASEQARC